MREALRASSGRRAPIEVVSTTKQREALEFVIKHSFYDDAYGLSPELLKHMTIDKWWDDNSTVFADPTWPVHDRIMGLQASTLTQLMNPTTLRRVYDNEFRVPADQDALTIPEVFATLTDAIWSELDASADGKKYTNRQPMILQA